MSLLNYSTQISVEKTTAEISRLLAEAKAQAVLTEYDPDGVLIAISFRVRCPFGLMSFRLPANIDNIFAVISRDRRITGKLKTRQQASRVAWRIVKDWIEAQMAMIRAEMVTIDQIFLPYAQNASGATLYDTVKAGSFHGLALPPPDQPVTR